MFVDLVLGGGGEFAYIGILDGHDVFLGSDLLNHPDIVLLLYGSYINILAEGELFHLIRVNQREK